MIKIEKINHDIPVEPYLTPPGYVDVFHSNTKTYMHWYYKQFKEKLFPLLPNDFKVGHTYGLVGKPLLSILCDEVDDTLYEIDYQSLLLMPNRFKKPLLEKCRILLTEFMEGSEFGVNPETGKKIIDEIKTEFNCRGIIEHDSGPMFALFTHCTIEQQFPNVKFNYNPKKLALVPARKPRSNRVRFLAKLHERKILEHCDWSLTFVEESADENAIQNGNADFFKSPNVNVKKFGLLKDSNEPYIQNFYNDYKDIFPKSFDMPNNHFSDTRLVSGDWFGNYNFKIAMETHEFKSKNLAHHFVTEKTFKGFLLGLPTMILGPKDIEKQVSEYGFEFFDFGYDHLEGDERINSMIDCLVKFKNIDLRDIALRNFDRIWDKKFLLELVLQRFK